MLDLSCRKREGRYWVVTDRWQRFSELEVSERTLADLGAYITSVSFAVKRTDGIPALALPVWVVTACLPGPAGRCRPA